MPGQFADGGVIITTSTGAVYERPPCPAEILNRIRTGEGQCPATHLADAGRDMTALDQCLDGTDHTGDHEGLFGNWPQEGTN